MRAMPSVAAIVVAYNSGDALTRCLDALRADDVPVVVVNNGAPIDVEREGVRVVEAEHNRGFGAGCNLGAQATDADVLVFLNPDTVAQPGAVAALADAARAGVVQVRLRLLDRPELLNSSGNVVHVSGLAWPGGYGEPADELGEQREIGYASGAALAIRADLFRELGGFDPPAKLFELDHTILGGARLAFVAPAVLKHDEPIAVRRFLEMSARGDRRRIDIGLHRVQENVANRAVERIDRFDERDKVGPRKLAK